MKISSLIAAMAAVALAPLAAAQTPADCATPANKVLLDNMVITSSIKRTTVKGGSRIVQTISVRNNNPGAAAGLAVGTGFTPAAVSLIKGRARAPGGSKLELTRGTGAATNIVSTLPATLSIPAGKTLKATIAFRAINCPPTGTGNNVFGWGPAAVAIPGDAAGIDCTLTSAEMPDVG